MRCVFFVTDIIHICVRCINVVVLLASKDNIMYNKFMLSGITTIGTFFRRGRNQQQKKGEE